MSEQVESLRAAIAAAKLEKAESLKAALEGLVREEHLTPNLVEETMKSYDDQLLAIDLKRDWSATANSSRPQWLHGSIEKGQLSEYNIVDGVVTFKLLQADFRGSAFPNPNGGGGPLTVKNVKVVLGDAKQIESGAVVALPAPPAAAGSSGTAAAAAPEAAAQLEMDGDSDDEAAVPQGDGAHEARGEHRVAAGVEIGLHLATWVFGGPIAT